MAAFKVPWWPPDRPVEGNTVYVRQAPDTPAKIVPGPFQDLDLFPSTVLTCGNVMINSQP